jgi:hypothetical protein
MPIQLNQTRAQRTRTAEAKAAVAHQEADRAATAARMREIDAALDGARAAVAADKQTTELDRVLDIYTSVKSAVAAMPLPAAPSPDLSKMTTQEKLALGLKQSAELRREPAPAVEAAVDPASATVPASPAAVADKPKLSGYQKLGLFLRQETERQEAAARKLAADAAGRTVTPPPQTAATRTFRHVDLSKMSAQEKLALGLQWSKRRTA